MQQHAKHLTQLYHCATKISSSFKKYQRNEEECKRIQMYWLDKAKTVVVASETLKVPRDSDVTNTKTLAIEAIARDMAKIMSMLPDMPNEPPKVQDDDCYSEQSATEEVDLMIYIHSIESRIAMAEGNIEIYEQAEHKLKKKLKLENGKNFSKLEVEKAKKRALERARATAKARFDYVVDVRVRREWAYKIETLDDYNSDSEDID